MQTPMVVDRGGEPQAVVFPLLLLLPQHEDNLVFNIDCQAAEHGPGFDLDLGERIQHKLVGRGLARFQRKYFFPARLRHRAHDSTNGHLAHSVRVEYIPCEYSHSAYSMAAMADDIKALLPLQATTFHILLSLTDEDRHGYAIILEVARRTQGELKLSAGTLYRSIQRMLETGLVVETRTRPAPEMDDERRRYYRITPLGKAVAEAEAGRLRDLLKMARLCGVAPRTT
jgi:DNA-binding PadR family transcriptional regulator